MAGFNVDKFADSVAHLVAGERAPLLVRRLLALLTAWAARGLAFAERLEVALQHQRTWICAIAALAVLQVALIFTHTPWFDEWQALQIALRSPELPDLFATLRYEGHPPLWYLLLRGLGTWLSPYLVLPIAVLLTAMIAQSCVLFASPFRRSERLMLASGCFLLFEFFTISRSASLGICTLIVAAALWRSRWRWLAIALLPMCDFLFGVISGILVLLCAREHRLGWPGVLLWLASGLTAAWSVIPAPDIVPALEPENPFLGAADFIARLGILLLPLQTNGLWPTWNGISFLGLGAFLGFGFLFLCVRETRDDLFHRAMLFGMIGLTFVFDLAIYHLPVRHLMLIAVLLIVLAWLKGLAGRPLSAALRVWLLAGSGCGLLVAAINLVVPFDNGARIAREIKDRGLEQKLWMAFPDAGGLGVGPNALTGMRFARPEQHCMVDFVHWNYRTTIEKDWQLYRYLRGLVAQRGRFYLLTDEPLQNAPADLLQPIVRIPAGYDDRSAQLFVVGPGRPDAATNLPPCVSGLRPLEAARGAFNSGLVPVG